MLSDQWRVEPGHKVPLPKLDPASTRGTPGDRAVVEKATEALEAPLAELQNRLWAEHRRSLLVVLQALDAGGKDGTIRKVFTGLNPQGVRVTSFKAPTPAELDHDFLWRVHAQTPARGEIAVFNRSHYEDVLIARVAGLVEETTWRARYGQIRDFEELLGAAGVTIVKLFLHISADEQAARFRERLSDPAKRWKFNPADLDVRAQWDAYQAAYADAIHETSTHDAPWYVIPADKKWVRNFAVRTILTETLDRLDPQYPPAVEGLDKITVV